MANFTFQIKTAKFSIIQHKIGKAYGKILWTDGTAELAYNFETISPKVIEVLRKHRGIEPNYKVAGTMTVDFGYGQHIGKTFIKFLITEIEEI